MAERNTAGSGSPPDGGRLWDESRRLSTHERADLERRLADARQRLGDPIFVLVVDRLGPETVPQLAARTFADRRLSASDGANPVLLVVSVQDRSAAIETGKGNAGIVPEVDAREITRPFRSRLSFTGGALGHALAQALTQAIDGIVTSAEATADRRRPSPASEDDPLPTAVPGGPRDGAAAYAAGNDADGATTGSAPPSTPEGKVRGRSRLPAAIAIAGLLLLALALRRRRSVSAAKEAKEHRPIKPPSRIPPR